MLPQGLIVSCQALPDEPLHSSFIMSKLALAAYEGGAVGIRANTKEDIEAIKAEVPLPVIGIVKRDYEGSEVFITATSKEVDELIASGCDVIALDATKQERPQETLAELVAYIREHSPHTEIMADISTVEEAINADQLGFDYIGTTLRGYTHYTKGHILYENDFAFKRNLGKGGSQSDCGGQCDYSGNVSNCQQPGRSLYSSRRCDNSSETDYRTLCTSSKRIDISKLGESK